MMPQLNQLTKAQLLATKTLLRKYFYKVGTNVALLDALNKKTSKDFEVNTIKAIYKQILHIGQLDVVSGIVASLGKADISQTQVENNWLSFVDAFPGGKRGILLFLAFAADEGGQAALDKMVPQTGFDLTNGKLLSRLDKRADFLVNALDKTGIDWAANEIASGIKNGLTSIQIVRDIRSKAINVSELRGNLTTETELMTAMNLVEVEAYKRNSIEKVVWKTAEDERVDSLCSMNEAAGAVTLGSEFPSGHISPLAHLQCRCYLLPVLPSIITGEIWTGQ